MFTLLPRRAMSNDRKLANYAGASMSDLSSFNIGTCGRMRLAMLWERVSQIVCTKELGGGAIPPTQVRRGVEL